MAAIEKMGEVDELHSNEESIKDGVSINGEVSIYNKENVEDDSNEAAKTVTNSSIAQDNILSDNEKSDEDNFDEIESTEENDIEYGEEKMETEEIHEINNSEDEEEEEEKAQSDIVNGINKCEDIIDESDKLDNTSIVINDLGEGDDGDGEDVVLLDDTSEAIENGTIDMTGDDVDIVETFDTNSKGSEDGEVISIDDGIIEKTLMKTEPTRRSIRNLNKEKRNYIEEDDDDEERKMKNILMKNILMKNQEESSEESESDIEEIFPQDPLAVSDPTPSLHIGKHSTKKKQISSSTIVVKDTKCLAEIASKSSTNNNNKKEPTLVIIDTNSILSGRGPVPISQKSNLPSSSLTNTYSMLPMALPAQGIYPPNMRATITPIPMTPPPPPPILKPTATVPPAPVLPTLTDDMFVVEAPSFIVPYVYEKPPIKELREFIKYLENEIIEEKKKETKTEKEKRDGEEGSDKTKKGENEEGKTDINNDKDKKSSSVNSEREGITDEKTDTDLPSMTVPSPVTLAAELRKPPTTYFDSPLGKFFMGIGYGLVQEAVQTDLLKQQKRKRDRESGQNPATIKTINSLIKNLEYTKENNEPYHMEIKKCEFCSFKTESSLAMAFHLETPHMKNYVYRCNFCSYEVRSPHDILFHMEVMHGVRGRLERAPAFHQCPNCSFEDNQKGKLSRHLVACTRKFKPDRNLEPPMDYEPPAKIPRAPRMKQQSLGTAAAVYQAMARTSQYQMMSKMANASVAGIQRGRGRPTLGTGMKQSTATIRPSTSMMYKQTNTMSGGSVLVPANYQLGGNQLYQQQQQNHLNKMKPVQQPSISITPLPRGSTTPSITITKPGDTSAKSSFVICEICDGYIKDLEQLRNHMQWIHKVKIHPKMIYNRPPLNCQKCQFRFFTDQGLERHLLGSHGLVTSSMQEAANRSKDAGRCPVCGRVYQWKLLNHVARDHNMTLKPAHLSYKCTVCTATFGMYKQFESHVYSAHSVVAKRVMDKKSTSSNSSGLTGKPESVLKPLKINDEITIIPQPTKASNGASGSREDSTPSTSGTSVSARNGNADFKESGIDSSLTRSERLTRRKTASHVDN